MRFGVIYFLFAGLDVPFPPRRDDGHIGGKRLYGEFEPDLVVAFAGAAVADCVGFFRLGYLDYSLGDDGTRKGSAEEIILVNGTRLDGGNDVFVDEHVGEVLDVNLGSAGLDCLLFQPFEFVRLTDVSRNGDDFAVVVVLFEPRNNYGSVETAGVSENDFLYLGFIHITPLVCFIF